MGTVMECFHVEGKVAKPKIDKFKFGRNSSIWVFQTFHRNSTTLFMYGRTILRCLFNKWLYIRTHSGNQITHFVNKKQLNINFLRLFVMNHNFMILRAIHSTKFNDEYKWEISSIHQDT